MVYSVNKRIDIFFIFLLLAYPFSYGRHILEAFGDTNVFSTALTQNSIVDAGFWNIYSIIAISIGYLMIGIGNYSNNTISNNNANGSLNKSFIIICWFFLIISLVPFFLNTWNNINKSLTLGYGYRIIEADNKVTLLGALSSYYLPSCMAISISNTKKKKIGILLLIVGLGLQMMSGTRISAFCYLVVMSYYLLNEITEKKNRRRMLLIITIVAVITVLLFSLISYNRTSFSHITSFNGFLKYFTEFINNNKVVKRVLNETGNSFQVSACVIQNCPNLVRYIYGYSYIYSVIYIIPNSISKLLFPVCINTDSAFAPLLASYGGVGSSFSAEAYYNFGVFGIFWLPIVGLFWRKLSILLDSSQKSNSLILKFISLQIALQMIFMVRSDMVYSLRNLVWVSGVMILISMLYSKFIGKSKTHSKE